MESALEQAKVSILQDPCNYHTICQSLLRKSPLTPLTISTLLQELKTSEFPQHKLLFWYALELLLVNNCNNFRTNKLATILNLQYSLQMQQLDILSMNDLFTGVILTAVHSFSVRQSRQIVPEMVGFLVRVCGVIAGEEREGEYRVVGFQEAIGMVLLENREEKGIVLHTVLGVLDGLLLCNPKLYSLDVIRKDLLESLEILKGKYRAEPYLSTLPTQLRQTQTAQADEIQQPEYKELTPRFSGKYVKVETIKDLKKKKSKMQKRLINDMRLAIHDRMQEQQIREDVRQQRIAKRYKKELYIVEKQTADARKVHRKIKRVKQQAKQSRAKNGKP